MNVPDQSAVTAWFLSLMDGGDGIQVGDHAAPKDAEYPYLVVWSIPGGSSSGPPLGQAAGDATLVFQVDSVGLTRAQSQSLASRVRERAYGRLPSGAFSAAAADPDGMSVSDRIPDGAPGTPVPEGAYPNEVWTTSDRVAVSVTALAP